MTGESRIIITNRVKQFKLWSPYHSLLFVVPRSMRYLSAQNLETTHSTKHSSKQGVSISGRVVWTRSEARCYSERHWIKPFVWQTSVLAWLAMGKSHYTPYLFLPPTPRYIKANSSSGIYKATQALSLLIRWAMDKSLNHRINIWQHDLSALTAHCLLIQCEFGRFFQVVNFVNAVLPFAWPFVMLQ